HAGVPKPKDSDERPQVKDPGNPPNHVSGIQPERHVSAMLDAKDKSVGELKALGFTAAHVVPHGKMLPGHGAVVLLGGESGEDMVLRDATSLFAQFKGSGGRYFPSTDMAIVAKWRELYARARQTQDHAKKYASNPRGMSRPTYSDVVASFHPVLDGKLPVFFHVDGIRDIHKALGLADELGFPLVLTGTGRAQLAMDRIKAAKTPLFLDLDLPEAKDKKDAKSDEEKDEKTVAEATAASLEKRRAAAMAAFESQAAMLAKAGMDFGFTTVDVKAKDIRANLGRMIKAGLTEDQALAALTTNPAKMLGLDAMLGTVEKGKIANLVVTDKPYFAEKSNVRYVFVDGMPEEYKVKKKKKKSGGDAEAGVNALGSWTLNIDAPVETPPATLTVTGEGTDLEATFGGMGGEDIEVNSLELDGDELTFNVTVNFGGESIVLSYDLTIDGDDIEGSVGAGNYGTFDVEGSRKDPE
ncbi:MAG: amidohydrolase family protein, partial [Bacteroidota bacterium]